MIESYSWANKMQKTVKFTISMSAAEFRAIEKLRRKAGRTRSQFIRDAVAAWRHGPLRTQAVKEDGAKYGSPPGPDLEEMTDESERRRRAIAAAGQFRSGVADLSSDHDRYLAESYAEGRPKEDSGKK